MTPTQLAEVKALNDEARMLPCSEPTHSRALGDVSAILAEIERLRALGIQATDIILNPDGEKLMIKL